MGPLIRLSYNETTVCKKPEYIFKISLVFKESLFQKLRRLLVRILVASATPLPDERKAIWSIPRVFQAIYFLILMGVCVPMIVDIARE